MKLIDKDALVAEIEKQMERAKFKAQQAQENNDYVSCVGWSEHFATCGDILNIINTLEVKEVDDEPECKIFPRPVECYSICKECPFLATNNKAQKGE